MYISKQSNKKNELVFTLMTCAPSGTLGDVSSCKKYIEQTLASQPLDSKVKIQFNLVITYVDDDATKKRIEALLGKDLSYNLIYATDDASFFEQPLFKKSSAFIFYPSFQITSDKHIRAIKALKIPTLIVNHYNFEASTDQRYAAKKEQWMPSLYTGFGPDSLGVNITDLGSTPKSVLIPKDDVAAYNLLFATDTRFASVLTADTIKEYSRQKTLFFGYMNKMGYLESRRNAANPTLFAAACIAKSQRQNPEKDIDILVRLNDKMDCKVDFNYYNQLAEHFKNNNSGLTVAIYKKNTEGTLVLKNIFGNGTTKVRIIDPFPITNNSMINVMQLSDPFCMMTGSESFIESLSCNKLPFYQIMHWHDRLYDELLKEIASIKKLGEASLLYQYFALQDKSKGITNEQLVEFLCAHEPQLLKQLEVFKQHLLVNKQLRTRLHNRLSELASNNEEYIHQCLGVQHIININDEPELTTKIAQLPSSIIHLAKMFPHSKDIICQNGAQLLAAIVDHNQEHAEKNMSDFVAGYKKFQGNKEDYNLFMHMVGCLADQKVKNLIVKAELNLFKTQLVHVFYIVKEKYNKDSTNYKSAMTQLRLIIHARENLINKLFSTTKQEDNKQALRAFHNDIQQPINILDNLLEEHLLIKTMKCFFKIVCAIIGIPIIAVMSTCKTGREHLTNFFFQAEHNEYQRVLRHAVQTDDQTTEDATIRPVFH